MPGYGDHPAPIIILLLAIFIYLAYWTILGCPDLISNCKLIRPRPAPSGSPGVTATAAASRPLDSAASPRATVAAPTTASTTSSDHSTVPISILRMLPDFVYSVAAQKQNLSCCVCLADFKDGEKGRFLPQCFHCFHVECIDVWLATHSQCPVCRASIDPAATELAV